MWLSLHQTLQNNCHPSTIDLQGESKKMSVKEMFDFLTLKMLPLALALIKTKNHHLFDPLVKNVLFQWKMVSSY